MMRRPSARAPAASPAPSARPTRTCPAMASASRTSARNVKMPKATWWAAREGAPARAATAPASEEAGQQRRGAHEDLRADRRQRPDRRPDGRRRSPRARSSSAANAAPMPSWARTVPAAEPSRPEVEPVDEHELEHDVRGVAGHDDDERRPQVAHAAQPALAGEREQRARDAEDRDPQVARGEAGRPRRRRPARAAPGPPRRPAPPRPSRRAPSASQSAWGPSAVAARSSPAPCSRATRAVVP